MKQILVIFAIIFGTVSCKEKLPSNISGALSWYNMNVESLNEIDSVIINLSEEDIDKLSSDSAFSLYAKHTNYTESTERAYQELQEFLKYSPQYSDHSQIKNKKYHFTIEKRLDYDSGMGKINSKVDRLYEQYSKN